LLDSVCIDPYNDIPTHIPHLMSVSFSLEPPKKNPPGPLLLSSCRLKKNLVLNLSLTLVPSSKKMFHQIKFLLVILIPIVSCGAERHRISFEGGYWTLYWEVLEDSQIQVELVGQTLGWVGLGLNTKDKMDLGELVIAGVNDTNGKPYFRTFTGKHHRVKAYKNEIWILNHAEQNATHTTIRAQRPLDPEDDLDINGTCPLENPAEQPPSRLPRSLLINRPTTRRPVIADGERFPHTIPILVSNRT